MSGTVRALGKLNNGPAERSAPALMLKSPRSLGSAALLVLVLVLTNQQDR